MKNIMGTIPYVLQRYVYLYEAGRVASVILVSVQQKDVEGLAYHDLH